MRFRRVIFWGHLISGVTIGSVLFVMAATGALLSFAPQLEEWAEKNVRVVTPGPQRFSYAQLAAKASAENPKIPVSGLIVNSNPAASVVIQFGKEKALFVDPYTGKTLGGPSKVHGFMHFVENLHRRLALGETGQAVTEACNLAFFVMILSGFYLWWPRNWNPSALKASFVFKTGLRGKARDWNWHNVIGFWTLPFLLTISVTGLIMSYPWANNTFFKLMGSEPPPQMQKMGGGRIGQAPIPGPAVDWDALIASASAKAEGWQTLMIRTPPKPDAPVSIFVQGAGGPEFARSQMTLDPKTAAVTKWEPFPELNKARQGRVWVRYIHTGEAWGLGSQVVGFLSALAAVLLVWTGFSMVWQRFFKKTVKQ